MSSSAITIPNSIPRTGSSSNSSHNSSISSSPASPSSSVGSPPPSSSSTTSSSPNSWHQYRRRPSLLSSSVSKAEHTSFELGIRDGLPRVITYVKTSQGFDWNEDIFLPSSPDITVHNGLRQAETVHEIVLTPEDRFLPM